MVVFTLTLTHPVYTLPSQHPGSSQGLSPGMEKGDRSLKDLDKKESLANHPAEGP